MSMFATWYLGSGTIYAWRILQISSRRKGIMLAVAGAYSYYYIGVDMEVYP